MTVPAAMFFGLILGAGIGALSMWLHLMQKYAGRQIDWMPIITPIAMAFAALFVVWLFRP